MKPRIWPLTGALMGIVVITTFSGCQPISRQSSPASVGSTSTGRESSLENTFTEDVAFLREYVDTIVLSSGKARVAVVPAYQGRVMTSSTGDYEDRSLGWLNYETIKQGVLEGDAAAGKLQAHIHVFGGEERFWLGPEGGQYGIYFSPGSAFEFDVWKTPAPIDTEAFDIERRDSNHVVFRRQFQVQNHSGFTFDVGVRRSVAILDRARISNLLGIDLGEKVDAVAYETRNEITNLGDAAWTTESGALSIWLLGMYKHSPKTTVVIPVQRGQLSDLGPEVNDEYFGKVPGDRLKLGTGAVFFRADGRFRSKIGVSPQRSRGIAGSYAADSQTLNLVLYERPSRHQGYVNSMWAVQDAPFSGDAINAYNDGSPEPGAAPLGPFYELETSSPAAFLTPGDSMSHVQRTIHLRGAKEVLDQVARQHLGVGIESISAAF